MNASIDLSQHYGVDSSKVVWNVMPYSLVHAFRRFVRTGNLDLPRRMQ